MPSRERRLFKASEKDTDEKRYLYEVDENGEIIDSVGAELRQARLDTGYEIQEISNSLRIRRAHLEAIEEGRYGDLPGPPYAVGFVRSYAKFLGLDAEAVVDRFKGEADNVDRPSTLDFPAPTDEGRMPKTWLIVVALVLAGLAYGGWQFLANNNGNVADRGGDVPEELASLATETPEASAPDITSPAGEGALLETFASPSETAMSAESSGLAVTVEELPLPEPGAIEGAVADEAAVTAEVEASVAAASVETGAAIEEGTIDGPTDEPTDEPGETIVPAGEVWSEEEPAPAPVVEIVPEEPLESATAATIGSEVGVTATTTTESSATGSASVGDNSWETANVPVEDQAGEVPTVGEASGHALLDSFPPAHEPEVYGAENTDARIVILSLGDSWVQVQGPDNELLLTRILHEGDSYRVPDRPGIVLMTGNAGALELWLDDTLLPSLGPVGLVRRDIALDPEALVAGDPPE